MVFFAAGSGLCRLGHDNIPILRAIQYPKQYLNFIQNIPNIQYFSTQYLKITIQYQIQYFNYMKNLKQYPIFSPNISIEQTISHTIFLSSFVGNTKPKTIFDFRKNTKQYPIFFKKSNTISDTIFSQYNTK